MIRILPSLASSNTSNMEAAIRSLNGYPYLHFDIEDGNFVDNITFGLKTIRAVRELTDAEFDAHLMVTDPLKYIAPLAELKFGTAAFHWESTGYPMRVINAVKNAGMRVSIALNPVTPASAITDYLQLVDEVLVMTSEPDGAGETFQPHIMKKIRRIREADAAVDITVDGGANKALLPELIAAGATKVVMGRAVFRAENPSEFIRECEEI